MVDLREVFEMTTKQVEPDMDSWRQQEERQHGAQRNRRLGALVVGMGLGIAVVMSAFFIAGGRTLRPDTDRQTKDDPALTELVPGQVPQGDYLVDQPPKGDYRIDLDTGEMTPLPDSIVGEGVDDRWDRSPSEYAASPDASKLVYTQVVDGGGSQAFVANLDGTGIVQVTFGLEGMYSPTWSPDGSKIAYIGDHDDRLRDLFVLDLATGGSTQLTFATHEPDPAAPDFGPWDAELPSFTPDGSSIVYTAYREGNDDRYQAEVRIVPAAGGESALLADGIYGAVLSPDGSLLASSSCAACGRSLADVGVYLTDLDGSHERVLVQGTGDTIPSFRWSPDSRWIAYWEFHRADVSIVDVSSGATWHVAEGYRPTWLDDHTLIVEMHDQCYDRATAARVRQGCGG